MTGLKQALVENAAVAGELQGVRASLEAAREERRHAGLRASRNPDPDPKSSSQRADWGAHAVDKVPAKCALCEHV